MAFMYQFYEIQESPIRLSLLIYANSPSAGVRLLCQKGDNRFWLAMALEYNSFLQPFLDRHVRKRNPLSSQIAS